MEQRIARLRSKGKLLHPIMQVGKNGITPGVLAQLDQELERHNLIKIRLLTTALPDDVSKSDRKAIAADLCTRLRAELVELVGNVLVLHRR